MLLFTVVFGSVTVTSPSVLKIPPPEPEVPVAELLFTKVAPETIKAVSYTHLTLPTKRIV